METLKNILWFLRLLDDDNKLSLTNIAVWITLVKLAMAASVVAPTDLGSLLVALSSYQAKRMIQQSSAAAAL